MLVSGRSACNIRAPMAGSPLKQGVRLADGRIIALPYMRRVADLPPGWGHFSAARMIEHLIGLDRCDEILSWGPITELDPLRLSFQMQVMRILLRIGITAVLDGSSAARLLASATGSASSENSRAGSVPVTSDRNWYGENRGPGGGVARNWGTTSQTA